jgi:hypothetical protein
MTNNTDDEQTQDRPATTASESTRGDEESWTRDRWLSLQGNPDEHDDLGYEYREWEQFETLDDTDQVMFLPENEAEIEDAAFVIAETDDHVDLGEHC